MPTLLNDVQLRVERSIFEAIRKKLVYYEYLPDITNARYTGGTAAQNEANWDTDLAAIDAAQQFAIEVFDHGSSLSKGLKRTPRLAIIPRRIMPGDIGTNIKGGFSPNPLDPDSTQKLKPTLQSANLHIDINVVPATAAQDRVMNAILGEALGQLSFIPMYDDPTGKEVFLIRQFNFYDLPDNRNGISEKSYSYEIPDLYLYEGQVTTNVPLISEITVHTTASDFNAIFTRTGSLIGPFVSDEGFYIDLSGITFKLPS